MKVSTPPSARESRSLADSLYQAAIGKQLVSLRVPVIRDSELRYILTIGLLPDQIGTSSVRPDCRPDGPAP